MEVDDDGLGLEIRVFVQRENVRVEWVGGYSMSRFSKLYRNVGIFQNRFSNVGILPNYPKNNRLKGNVTVYSLGSKMKNMQHV